MKKTLLVLPLFVALSASVGNVGRAQETEPDVSKAALAINNESVHLESLTLATQSIKNEIGNGKRFYVNSVNVEPNNDADVTTIIVKGEILTVKNPRSSNVEPVTYVASVFKKTGKVIIKQIDTASAREVAFAFLAKMNIAITDEIINGDKITYIAVVARQKCTVNLSRLKSAPTRWVVDKLDCSDI